MKAYDETFPIESFFSLSRDFDQRNRILKCINGFLTRDLDQTTLLPSETPGNSRRKKAEINQMKRFFFDIHITEIGSKSHSTILRLLSTICTNRDMRRGEIV